MWLTVAVYISSISISFHDFTSLCSHCRKMWFLFWLICDSDHNFFQDTHRIRFFILIWATSIETCSDCQSKCIFFCVYPIIIWFKCLTVHNVYRNCSDPICVSRGTLLFSWISALFSMATTMTAIQILCYSMMTCCRRGLLNIMRQRQKHAGMLSCLSSSL